VFQVKKSSHSRRIAKMIKRQHRQEKEEKAKLEPTDALASTPGSYSAENIKVFLFWPLGICLKMNNRDICINSIPGFYLVK